MYYSDLDNQEPGTASHSKDHQPDKIIERKKEEKSKIGEKVEEAQEAERENEVMK